MSQMLTSASQDQLEQSSSIRLQRNLSVIETWGFGLTGLLLWMGVAPGAHNELGSQAMWVWIPGAIIGILINLQVRQLGQAMPDVAEGKLSILGRHKQRVFSAKTIPVSIAALKL